MACSAVKIRPVATLSMAAASSFGRPPFTIALNRANIPSTSDWRIFRSSAATSGVRSRVGLSICLSGPLAIESSRTESLSSAAERSKCGMITPIDPVSVAGSA